LKISSNAFIDILVTCKCSNFLGAEKEVVS